MLQLQLYIFLTILSIQTNVITTASYYWWEHLNYYEILGLEGDDSTTTQQPQIETSIITNYHPNRRIITKKRENTYHRSKIAVPQIKKSYRKEAQKYHPDKAGGRKRQEEFTSRFNRIKEAYDTLSNEDSRIMYEEELYYEEKIVSRERVHVLNSLELWEDEENDEGVSQEPLKVYESVEHGYDPRTNRPFVRMHKREEFLKGDYRIWVQDFIQTSRSDPPIPLGPPQLVEEYMDRKNQLHRPTTKTTTAGFPYQLNGGESTRILQSSNELYRAKLTYDCELVIVRRKPLPHLKSKIVWSSRTYLVPKEEEEEAPQCSFMFVNRQLIVYTSSPSGDEKDRSIVWYSTPPPSLNETTTSFLVLENDGVLSIYFHTNSTNTKPTTISKLFPFFQNNSSNPRNYVMPFVNTQQQQLYCTKASQLWNTCYQKALQKLPIIDVYSKKTVHVLQQKVAAYHSIININPIMRKMTDVWYESYHKTIHSIQNAVIRLTHTSIYHPKDIHNTTTILCIWSTNGCTPFPIVRLVRFAFLALQYQFIRSLQRIIHSISNLKQPQDEHYYYDEDDTTDNPIEWISTVGRQMYQWGRNSLHDLFSEDEDDFLEEEDDYIMHVYLRSKMNGWKDTMNHRMDMPF